MTQKITLSLTTVFVEQPLAWPKSAKNHMFSDCLNLLLHYQAVVVKFSIVLVIVIFCIMIWICLTMHSLSYVW